MRVNVTYSVRLEEVNRLVEGILLEIEKQFEKTKSEFPEILHTVVEDQNEKRAVELLNQCRQDLIETTHRLGDCESLLLGYQNTLLQLASAENKKEVSSKSFDTSPKTQKLMEDVIGAQQDMSALFSSLQPNGEENDTTKSG